MLPRKGNYRPVRNGMAEPVAHTSRSLRQIELQIADSDEKPYAIFEGKAEGKRSWPPDCLKDLEDELLSIGSIGDFN